MLGFLLLVSCEHETDNFQANSGDADFTVYVALGNSLTAGFADGDLFKSGQMLSYANIIAKQMYHAGGGEFNIPMMKDEAGFGNRVMLGYSKNCQGISGLGAVNFPESPDPANFNNIFNTEGPFHNLGVPGARIAHLSSPLSSTSGNFHAYYSRFASSSSSSVIDDAVMMNPDFFSLWIGSNDVLGFALSGGVNESITGTAIFAESYRNLLEKLTQRGAKGVVANIPDITSIPFFNTLSPMGINLSSQEQADELNSHYASQGLQHITFAPGANPFVVVDPAAPGQKRQLTPAEVVLLILPQDNVLCEGWGTTTAIPAHYYLSEAQLSVIKTAIASYNTTIEKLASEYELAFADMNKLLREAQNGIIIDGLEFNTQYILGGIFSLDGIHLSARGNAIAANHFIEAINREYNAQLPRVSPAQYPGIVLP